MPVVVGSAAEVVSTRSKRNFRGPRWQLHRTRGPSTVGSATRAWARRRRHDGRRDQSRVSTLGASLDMMHPKAKSHAKQGPWNHQPHSTAVLVRRTPSWWVARRLAGRPHFKYESPVDPNASLSVCVCAKCGSTAIYWTLYGLVDGRPRKTPLQSVSASRNQTLIHEFLKWGAPGVSAAVVPSRVHLHVIRDPLARYLSAFKSKVMCCPGLPRRPCYSDQKRRHIARRLLRQSGNPTWQNASSVCLFLDEFVAALEGAHRYLPVLPCASLSVRPWFVCVEQSTLRFIAIRADPSCHPVCCAVA